MPPKQWFRDVYCDALWEAEDLSATEKAIGETYARHVRDQRGAKAADADLAWLTYERLMAKAGIRRRASVAAGVSNLVKQGWLKPVEQVGRRPTLYRLTIPLGSSTIGTTESGLGSSDGGTTVVPFSTLGSSTLSNLPHPGSSDGGTPPLPTPQSLTPTSLSQPSRTRGTKSRGRKGGESFDQKGQRGKGWQQASVLADQHAAGVIGVERHRLVAAIHAALDRGWPEAVLGNELARDTSGADSVAAVLIARMKRLGDPTDANLAAVASAAWCGRCDERTRKVPDFSMYGGHPIERPCPRCAAGGPQPRQGHQPWLNPPDDEYDLAKHPL